MLYALSQPVEACRHTTPQNRSGAESVGGRSWWRHERFKFKRFLSRDLPAWEEAEEEEELVKKLQALEEQEIALGTTRDVSPLSLDLFVFSLSLAPVFAFFLSIVLVFARTLCRLARSCVAPRSLTLRVGGQVGIAGRVWQSRKVEWETDVSALAAHQFARKESAIKAGLRG
eukprot:603250-Rhodomonas_salina.1